MIKLYILGVIATFLSTAFGEWPEAYAYEQMKSTPQHVCPSPREAIMVRCPSRYEVTTATTTCRKKIRIDECASY
jgi:hypothetical protein